MPESELDEVKLNTTIGLRDYQIKGAKFLVRQKGGILAFQVGLGKTPTSLAAFEHVYQLGDLLLIVCPSTLKLQWQEEIVKFTPHFQCVVIDGTEHQRKQQWGLPSEIYVINYEQLRTEYDNIAGRKWRMVILDEAHKLGNADALTPVGRLAKKNKIPLTAKHYTVARLARGLVAEYKVCLTGTPISNAPHELWGLLAWLNKDVAGSFWSFTQRYCVFIDQRVKGGKTVKAIAGAQRLDELNRVVAPFLYRVSKDEALPDLLPAREVDVEFELSTEEADAYTKIRLELLFELGPILSKVTSKAAMQNALVKALRLQQLTASMELLGDMNTSTKATMVHGLVASAPTKVVVYTRFVGMTRVLETKLAEFSPLVISGAMKPANKHAIISLFNTDNEHRVLIITDAAREGLNLHYQAAVQILCEVPFSLGKKTQLEGRVHRFGQDKEVTIYYMLARVNGKKSIDHHIKNISALKARVADKVLLRPREVIKEILS